VRVHHLSECYIASTYHNEGTLALHQCGVGDDVTNIILTYYCVCMYVCVCCAAIKLFSLVHMCMYACVCSG
jgi:hypothetical protein